MAFHGPEISQKAPPPISIKLPSLPSMDKHETTQHTYIEKHDPRAPTPGGHAFLYRYENSLMFIHGGWVFFLGWV